MSTKRKVLIKRFDLNKPIENLKEIRELDEKGYDYSMTRNRELWLSPWDLVRELEKDPTFKRGIYRISGDHNPDPRGGKFLNITTSPDYFSFSYYGWIFWPHVRVELAFKPLGDQITCSSDIFYTSGHKDVLDWVGPFLEELMGTEWWEKESPTISDRFHSYHDRKR